MQEGALRLFHHKDRRGSDHAEWPVSGLEQLERDPRLPKLLSGRRGVLAVRVFARTTPKYSSGVRRSTSPTGPERRSVAVRAGNTERTPVRRRSRQPHCLACGRRQTTASNSRICSRGSMKPISMRRSPVTRPRYTTNPQSGLHDCEECRVEDHSGRGLWLVAAMRACSRRRLLRSRGMQTRSFSGRQPRRFRTSR